MDPIVVAAGSALVSSMATDAWLQARAGFVRLWRRVRPEQVEAVETELAEVRAEVLAARENGDGDIEQALAGSWQIRLQQLLRADPGLTAELRRLLDDELTPMLAPAEQTRIWSIMMKASASGHGRIYQAGRDQHITEK